MIDGTANELAGAFAQLLTDRGMTEAEALAACQRAEKTDGFWEACNRIADAINLGEDS